MWILWLLFTLGWLMVAVAVLMILTKVFLVGAILAMGGALCVAISANHIRRRRGYQTYRLTED